jgi:hypothetical protein
VAGLLGALAAATRSVGVLLVIPLALLALEAGRGGRRGLPRPRAPRPRGLLRLPRPLGRRCAGALPRPGGLAALVRGAVRRRLGRDGGRLDGARQLLHGRRTPVYFEAAGGDPFEVARRTLVDFGFLVFAAVATVGALRRLPLAYGAWALAALALPLSWPVEPQPLMSLGRFVLVLFPLQLWLAAALVDRGMTDRWLAASGGGLAILSAQFAAWEFVG